MLDIQFPVFPVLQSSRCVLRQVVKTDAPQLLALRSDAAVMQYLDREAMTTVDEAGVMIDSMDSRLATGEGISWAISLIDSNEMIGLAGLWRIIKEHHRAEIGSQFAPRIPRPQGQTGQKPAHQREQQRQQHGSDNKHGDNMRIRHRRRSF